MDVSPIAFPLVLSQLLNWLVTALWLSLIVVALWRLRRATITDEAKALWAGLIVLIPFLGALAFWVVMPGRPLVQPARKGPYLLPGPGRWEIRRQPVDVTVSASRGR